MDSARIYTDCQNRLIALAGTLDPGRLATVVPACPAWTVQQVYAHLAGLCADVPAGAVTPPADDATTARQVAAHAHLDIEGINDAWRAATPALLEAFATRTRVRYRLPVVDVWHHENDVRGALGLGPQTEDADQLAAFAFGGLARVWPADRPAVLVRAADTGQEWALGEGRGLVWSGSVFELLRAAMGRRTPERIRAMDWSGDPAAVVASLSMLPAPDTDLVV